MAWQCEHSADSDARPEAVWRRYVDVENWREWSKGVEESSLEGNFEVGAKGRMKAPNLPKVGFELTAVEPEKRYESKAKMPGGTVTLDHVIEPTDRGTRITHRATLDGRLDFLLIPLIGRVIKRELPASVERLAELAVDKEKEEREETKEEQEREARLKEADEHFKSEIEKTATGGKDPGAPSLPGSG